MSHLGSRYAYQKPYQPKAKGGDFSIQTVFIEQFRNYGMFPRSSVPETSITFSESDCCSKTFPVRRIRTCKITISVRWSGHRVMYDRVSRH